MNCLTCKFAEWDKTANGRLHPNKQGQCKYEIPKIIIPKAFYFFSSGDQKPCGGYIYRDKPLTDCPTYQPIQSYLDSQK